jgi:hypothetical protein
VNRNTRIAVAVVAVAAVGAGAYGVKRVKETINFIEKVENNEALTLEEEEQLRQAALAARG